MLNITQVTAPNGALTLTFSMFAVRRFCKIIGCKTNTADIERTLFGEETYDVVVALIQSGVEATAAAAKQPYTLTEYEVNAIADTATPEEGEQMIYAFLGSVIGKPTEEVLPFMKARLAELAAKKEAEDPNV